MKNWIVFSAVIMAIAMSAPMVNAETRVTYKSAKTTSSYYQMAVQIAEAMKAGSDGDIIVTVEESQGSVQNVMETRARGGDYVFTTPPVLVKLAKAGKAMFKDKGSPKRTATSRKGLSEGWCQRLPEGMGQWTTARAVPQRQGKGCVQLDR